MSGRGGETPRERFEREQRDYDQRELEQHARRKRDVAQQIGLEPNPRKILDELQAQSARERARWQAEETSCVGFSSRACGARATDTPASDETARVAPIVPVPEPPLPNATQLRSYTHGTIGKAVRQLAEDGTPGDVVRGSGRVKMSPPDARRVRALWLGALSRFSAAGKLVVDERIARDPKDAKRYVLRYRSADGTRWLDPRTEPPTP